MKELRVVVVVLMGASLAIFASCRLVDSSVRDEGIQSMNTIEKAPDIDYSDPCWDTKPGALYGADPEMMEKRRIRNEIAGFGFPKDTPLRDAVRILNEIMSCRPDQQYVSPLTEEEVVAAIAVNAMGRDAFWKIATSRIVPKGTVLTANSGGNMMGTPLAPDGIVSPEGIEIIMILDADKDGRDAFPPPPLLEEMLTIRKVFTNLVIR